MHENWYNQKGCDLTVPRFSCLGETPVWFFNFKKMKTYDKDGHSSSYKKIIYIFIYNLFSKDLEILFFHESYGVFVW